MFLLSARSNGEEAVLALPIPLSTTDDELIALWLHAKSPHTIRAYRKDITAYLTFSGKTLRTTYLSDLQKYADSLTGAPATRARPLKALKSLLSFAARLGYVPFNVGIALRGIKAPDALAERILNDEQIRSILEAVNEHPRDHALLRLLYNGGLRVSELTNLRRRNLIDGVANIVGKGGKTRVVHLSRGTWTELQALLGDEGDPDERVFPMSTVNAWRRVRRAARLAGIAAPVSPHFLRHSHATHALRRGADLAVVRDTLGHASVAVTGRYLHARPEESSGDYLPY